MRILRLINTIMLSLAILNNTFILAQSENARVAELFTKGVEVKIDRSVPTYGNEPYYKSDWNYIENPSCVVSIINESSIAIVYDQDLIIDKLRNGFQLLTKRYAKKITHQLITSLLCSAVSSGFFFMNTWVALDAIKNSNQRLLAAHARNVANHNAILQNPSDDQLGESQAAAIPLLSLRKWRRPEFIILSLPFALLNLLSLRLAWLACTRMQLSSVETLTIIKPGQMIRFYLWLEDEDDDPKALVYSALKFQDKTPKKP